MSQPKFVYAIRDKRTNKLVSKKCNKDKFYTMRKMAERKVESLNDGVRVLNEKMGRPNDSADCYELVKFKLQEVKE